MSNMLDMLKMNKIKLSYVKEEIFNKIKNDDSIPLTELKILKYLLLSNRLETNFGYPRFIFNNSNGISQITYDIDGQDTVITLASYSTAKKNRITLGSHFGSFLNNIYRDSENKLVLSRLNM